MRPTVSSKEMQVPPVRARSPPASTISLTDHTDAIAAATIAARRDWVTMATGWPICSFVGKLAGRGTAADRHHDAAGLEHGEDRNHRLPAVVHEHHHAGAARDAAGLQGCRQTVRFEVEFGIAVAGTSGDDRRMCAMPGYAFLQPFLDAHPIPRLRPKPLPRQRPAGRTDPGPALPALPAP